jgi:hypothetical protein
MIVTASLASVLALSGSAVAVPSGGMPGPSWFGLCTAWDANGGNDNPGNAPNAPPFAWLQDQAEEADQTVAEWCAENAPHPGNGNGPGNGPGGPPGGAPGGPPGP